MIKRYSCQKKKPVVLTIKTININVFASMLKR